MLSRLRHLFMKEQPTMSFPIPNTSRHVLCVKVEGVEDALYVRALGSTAADYAVEVESTTMMKNAPCARAPVKDGKQIVSNILTRPRNIRTNYSPKINFVLYDA